MAAQNGVLHIVTQRGTLDVSLYFDDSAGNPVRLSLTGKAAAASPDFLNIVGVVTDFVLAAATGQTTTQVVVNGVPRGDYFLNALHLASVTVRPQLRIPISGTLRLYQLA